MKKEIPALVALWVLILMLPVKAQDLPGKVVYSVPGMDTVEVQKNLVYKKDGPDELKMDIAPSPRGSLVVGQVVNLSWNSKLFPSERVVEII